MKNKIKYSTKKPQLIAPINALDERTAEILYENQKVLLDNLIGFSELVISIKRDMREQVIEEVEKEIGDKIKMIDGALTQTILMLRVFMDKGLITKDEIEKKHKELKSKK